MTLQHPQQQEVCQQTGKPFRYVSVEGGYECSECRAFFKKLDYTVIHVPNFIALHYAYLIAQFLGLMIVGTSKMDVLFK